MKHTHTHKHTPLSLFLSHSFALVRRACCMPGASFSNKKKLGKLRQLRVVCQLAAANDGSDAGRGRLKVQVEIEFVIELSTHTHSHRQARARSPCQLRARKCAMLFVGSAQAPLCSGLRQQHVATPGSRDGQQQQVALINVSRDSFTCSLSLFLALSRSLAALATCQQQLLRGLNKQ